MEVSVGVVSGSASPVNGKWPSGWKGQRQHNLHSLESSMAPPGWHHLGVVPNTVHPNPFPQNYPCAAPALGEPCANTVKLHLRLPVCVL